ncbi:MAG: class I SAM-dependent methyltransferase [bacterium]|nr:class I SAM-dependent methyltransferase [bacterium]
MGEPRDVLTFDALAERFQPRDSDAASFLYDSMESQSGQCLPVIYRPFDCTQRMHFVDRGQILDFAAVVGDGRILDFGPGDGWPSLSLAPMADEVVGVDGSRRRVDVCAQNAERMGIANVEFVFVEPGAPLPFDDSSFDGVAAASSIEQTPNPRETLAEIHRVLKPGGRLRMHYESLAYYADGKEREVSVIPGDEEHACVVVYEREIDAEHVRHLGVLARMPANEVEAVVSAEGNQPSGLTETACDALAQCVDNAVTWMTQHPSCATWLRWLSDAGFESAMPTHSGGGFAQRLYNRLGEDGVPQEVDAVDALLREPVAAVTEMEAPSRSAPGRWDPWITAVR